MAAVTIIFVSSAHHYLIIGAGLDVRTDDLMPIPGAAENNLIIVFKRWFDANRDVNWATLIKLCEYFPDQLGKAKSELLAYIGKFSHELTTYRSICCIWCIVQNSYKIRIYFSIAF